MYIIFNGKLCVRKHMHIRVYFFVFFFNFFFFTLLQQFYYNYWKDVSRKMKHTWEFDKRYFTQVRNISILVGAQEIVLQWSVQTFTTAKAEHQHCPVCSLSFLSPLLLAMCCWPWQSLVLLCVTSNIRLLHYYTYWAVFVLTVSLFSLSLSNDCACISMLTWRSQLPFDIPVCMRDRCSFQTTYLCSCLFSVLRFYCCKALTFEIIKLETHVQDCYHVYVCAQGVARERKRERRGREGREKERESERLQTCFLQTHSKEKHTQCKDCLPFLVF